jgi:hypothetical protein
MARGETTMDFGKPPGTAASAKISPPGAAPEPAPPGESCGNHPGIKVRYHCQNEACGFLGCTACVRMHVSKSSGAATPWCWKCGERVVEIQSAADVRAEAGPPFYTELGKVFGYPFGTEGRYLFAVLLLVMGVITVTGGIISLGVRALLVIYPLQVIRQTAKGVKHLPEFADIFDPDAFWKFVYTALIYAAYYIPAIALFVLKPDPEEQMGLILLLLLAQWVALLMLPMGLAIMAMEDAWITAISPYHVGREILKVPKDYFIMLAVTVPMSAVRFGLPYLMTGEGILTGLGFKILLSLLDFYNNVVQAHILGRIVRERKDVLHWD